MNTIYESAFDDTEFTDDLTTDNIADIDDNAYPYMNPDGEYNLSLKIFCYSDEESSLKTSKNISGFIHNMNAMLPASLTYVSGIDYCDRPIFTIDYGDYMSRTDGITTEYEGCTYLVPDGMNPETYITDYIKSMPDNLNYICMDIKICIYPDRITEPSDRIKMIIRLFKSLRNIRDIIHNDYHLTLADSMHIFNITPFGKAKHKATTFDFQNFHNINRFIHLTYDTIFLEEFPADANIPDSSLRLTYDYQKSVMAMLNGIMTNPKFFNVSDFTKNVLKIKPSNPNTMIGIQPFGVPMHLSSVYDKMKIVSDGNNSSITFDSVFEFKNSYVEQLSEFYKYHIIGHIDTLHIFTDIYDESLIDKTGKKTKQEMEMTAYEYYFNKIECDMTVLDLTGVSVDRICISYPFHVTKVIFKVKTDPDVEVTEIFDSDNIKN